MILAYRSCGTPLYPVIIGNGTVDTLGAGGRPISAADKARYVLAAGLYPGRLPGLLLAFTAGLALPARASLALRASLAGTALAALMLLDALVSAHLVDATDRYLFPYGLAYLLAVALVAAGAVTQLKTPAIPTIPTIKPARSMLAMALVVGTLALPLAQRPDDPVGFYIGELDGIQAAWADSTRSQSDPGGADSDAVYGALQGSVPEGATLLVVLDQPFRLDFTRNRILTWDAPGLASPPPHLPVGRGPDALARYLFAQGVRYVAYCDGPSPEYMPSARIQDLYRLGQGIRYVAYCDRGPSPGYPKTASRIVADLQKLAATRKQLYGKDGTHVLDLATPGRPAA